MKRRAGPGPSAAAAAPHYARLAALESALAASVSTAFASAAASSAAAAAAGLGGRRRSDASSSAAAAGPLAALDDAQREELRALLPRLSAAAFALVRQHAEDGSAGASSAALSLVEPVDASLARRVAQLETEAASLTREIRTARSQVRAGGCMAAAGKVSTRAWLRDDHALSPSLLARRAPRTWLLPWPVPRVSD